MDYQVVGIVVLLCVIVVLGIDYLPQKLKDIKLNFDLKSMFKSLKDVALVFGNDEQDKIVGIIYDILLDAYIYAENNLEFGIVDYDALLFFVEKQVKTAGIEIGEVEERVLDMACEVISSFLYNKNK